MKKRIKLIFIVSLILSFLVTGCWSKEEVDDLTIVAGIGMDAIENKKGVELTVQAILPEEIKEEVRLEEGQKPVWTGTVTGSSVFDAARNLALLTGSKTLWGHSQVLVIGEEIAKQGVKETIDWFERSIEVRRRIFVMVAKGEAKNVIEAKGEMESIPAFNIGKLNEGSGATSKAVSRDLLKFIGTLPSKTTSAVLPGIVVYNKEDRDGNESKALKLQDTAVFKDYKLTGWLNKTETRGLLWALGEVKSGIIDVENPSNDKVFISFETIKAISKIKPIIKDGQLTIMIEVKEEGNIAAVSNSAIDISKSENIVELEKRKEAAIEQEIHLAIKKAKELNADVFGMGEAVHRKYPKEWKELESQWNDIFPSLQIDVKVNAKIRRTGLITIKKH